MKSEEGNYFSWLFFELFIKEQYNGLSSYQTRTKIFQKSEAQEITLSDMPKFTESANCLVQTYGLTIIIESLAFKKEY